MKEVEETSVGIIIPCVKIYYDDVEKIVGVLSGLNPKSINLQANNKSFEFSEIGLLNTDLLKLLKINTRFDAYEFFSIEFSKHNIWICCSQNTTQVQGVARQIEGLLKIRRRPFGLITSYYIPTITLILSGIPLIVVAGGYFFGYFHAPVQVMVSLTIIYSVSLYFDSFYGNVIFLKPKSSYKNIVERTKDQLFVNIVSNSVAAVIGAIIGFLLGRFTK